MKIQYLRRHCDLQLKQSRNERPDGRRCAPGGYNKRGNQETRDLCPGHDGTGVGQDHVRIILDLGAGSQICQC